MNSGGAIRSLHQCAIECSRKDKGFVEIAWVHGLHTCNLAQVEEIFIVLPCDVDKRGIQQTRGDRFGCDAQSRKWRPEMRFGMDWKNGKLDQQPTTGGAESLLGGMALAAQHFKKMAQGVSF